MENEFDLLAGDPEFRIAFCKIRNEYLKTTLIEMLENFIDDDDEFKPIIDKMNYLFENRLLDREEIKSLCNQIDDLYDRKYRIK